MNHISLKQILKIQADTKVKFEIPTDPEERFYQLFDLVKVMSADHRIHPNEMRLCELFAIRFGYRKENIKELIEGIRDNIAHGNGPDETMIVLSSLVI